MSRRGLCGVLCAMLATWSCAPAEPNIDSNVEVEILPVFAELRDELVVAGGGLVIDISGADVLVPGSATVEIIGALDGQDVTALLPASVDEEGGLTLIVDWTTLESAGVQAGSVLEGTLAITIDDLSGLIQGAATITNARVEFVDGLTPAVSITGPLDIFLGDRTEHTGSGLLREGEGETQLRVEGTFTTTLGTTRDIDETLSLPPATAGRETIAIVWPAHLFGIRTGSFVGTVTPINRLALGGAERAGEPLSLTLNLLQTELDAFDPPAASRGQVVNVLGRGFFPADADRGLSMFFRFDGTFTTRKGTVIDFSGSNAVQLAPEAVPAHTTAELTLRSEYQERSGRLELVGLTSTPGTFEGTVTPVLIEGSDVIDAQSVSLTFSIAPTKQVVYVKFLPSYVDSLEKFGLRNVEREIRDRIFEVLARDYAGFNIEFQDTRPKDFVEYSIIEVGGPDPNGAGLFGLDNTEGKDTGNIRLNDVVGSENASSSEQGFYSFGGVFIESFRTFSPTLDSDSEIADEAFDTIFSPFMSALDGTPVDGTEWPVGPRSEAIEDAIHTLGSLIGNTVSHEIGHSLGLSFFQEDLFSTGQRFHNDFDEDGAIMDAGSFRPFIERAELDGAPAPHFNERNTKYLQDILPIE